ncbi:LIG1 [Lepeophtheirus salmonis]|uniref:LIG1 n=1 Tax=Lepeophtheirus salmonis TaxID=72036 RepID=A0A7R8HA92_LEPSM|nr:LIG1 [Lepeophtheirus salmonis]CAF2972281.1 LIG1 [Lepeophtheirus salmonis]
MQSLFLIEINGLEEHLKQTSKVRSPQLILLYADDLTIPFRGRNLFVYVGKRIDIRLSYLSGLVVNLNKTEVISSVDCKLKRLFPSLKFFNTTTLLGISITKDGGGDSIKLNFSLFLRTTPYDDLFDDRPTDVQDVGEVTSHKAHNLVDRMILRRFDHLKKISLFFVSLISSSPRPTLKSSFLLRSKRKKNNYVQAGVDNSVFWEQVPQGSNSDRKKKNGATSTKKEDSSDRKRILADIGDSPIKKPPGKKIQNEEVQDNKKLMKKTKKSPLPKKRAKKRSSSNSKSHYKSSPPEDLTQATNFDAIEATSGRLKTIEILANYLRSLLVLSPDDLLMSIYLCLNRLAPAYEGVELGVGDGLLIKAIAQTTGRATDKIKAEVERRGDLGLVAESSRGTQRTMFKPQPLTINSVFNKLKEVAMMSGTLVYEFLIRSLAGKLRIGLAEQSVLQAIAHACLMTPPGQDYPPEVMQAFSDPTSDKFKEALEPISLAVKNCLLTSSIAFPNVLRMESLSCVLDSEAVAWNRDKKMIQPFQVLSTRKRKDADSREIKLKNLSEKGVWEIKAADLSISPTHRAANGIVDPQKGISLRFPRFIRIRDDKNPEDATSSQQIADLYNSQEQVKNQSKKSDKEDDFEYINYCSKHIFILFF